MRPAAALALLMTPGLVLSAGTRREWDFAAFSYVKRAPAEKDAAPNSQPVVVDRDALARDLASLKFVSGHQDVALFIPSEVAVLAPTLVEALALAGPGEDLVLLSTKKRDDGFFADSLAVTARVFVQDGKLNVIVQDPRVDFIFKYNYENRMPEFDFGGRHTSSAVVLKAEGAEFRRPNWVVMRLAAAAPAPVPVPQPAAAPVPLQPAAAPPAPRPAALPPTIEDRLRDLKRFREQNLITEEEYTKQKQELLEEFRKGGAPRAR